MLVNDIFGGDRYAQWDRPLWEHDLPGGLQMLRMGIETHVITAPSPCRCCSRAARACSSR